MRRPNGDTCCPFPILPARRPGLQERARYYAVVYLNQMVLNHKQPAQTAGAHGCASMRIGLVTWLVFSRHQAGAWLAGTHASQAALPCQFASHHQLASHPTAGGSLPRRLIDVYFTVFKMVLDGKIGTAAQVRWVAMCLEK